MYLVSTARTVTKYGLTDHHRFPYCSLAQRGHPRHRLRTRRARRAAYVESVHKPHEQWISACECAYRSSTSISQDLRPGAQYSRSQQQGTVCPVRSGQWGGNADMSVCVPCCIRRSRRRTRRSSSRYTLRSESRHPGVFLSYRSRARRPGCGRTRRRHHVQLKPSTSFRNARRVQVGRVWLAERGLGEARRGRRIGRVAVESV